MDPRTPTRPGPSRRLTAAVLASTLWVGVAACSTDDDTSSGGSDSSEVAPGAAELEPAITVDPGTAPVIDLLDAGTGEKRVLEYAPSLEPAVVEVTRSATAETTVPGSEPRRDVTPEQTLTVRGESEPDVDGAQRATVTVEDFSSVDELRDAQFSTAPGFTVTWTRGAAGVVSEMSLEAPAGATDAARTAVEITVNAVSDATVAWPSEPIGVGARWTVTRQVDDAVAPTRVTTYELTALDGDAATVSVRASAPEVAETLSAPAPDGGPGVTLDVETYEVTGTGELTIDLRAALPVEGTTESSTRAVYTDPETGRQTTYDEDSELRFSSAD